MLERTAEQYWNTALHESGHVVAALAGGWRVDKVSIIPHEVPGGWFVGSIDIAGRPMPKEIPTAPWKQFEAYLVYLLSGPAAERLFSPHPCPRAIEYASYPQGDIGKARRIVEARASGAVDERIEKLMAWTEEFLRPRQRKVEAIARALVKRREMDGKAVAGVLCLQVFSTANR